MARAWSVGWLIAMYLVGVARAGDVEQPQRVGRRALLVGCTDYRLANLPDLWGPSNDVPAWSQALVRRLGFAEREVRMLVGWPENPADRPTRENIVKGIEDLLARSASGDQALIVLAGHGAQIPAAAPAPGGGHVEADGLDEVFLPADVRLWAEGRLENAIVDDEIGRWLNQFRRKGVHAWVVFDCCHASGLAKPTNLRDDDPAPDYRAVHFKDLNIPHSSSDPSRAMGPARFADPGPGWLDKGWDRGEGSGSVALFYACGGSELTPELPRPKDAPRVPANYYGLFSYTLISTLTRSSRPPTYRDLGRLVDSRYLQERPDLPPRIAIEGAVDRVPLGFSAWPDPPILSLTRASGGTWTIGGGELLGLVDGSILAIHSAAGDPQPPKEILGYLRVKNLGPTTAQVEPTSHAGRPPVSLDRLSAPLMCQIVPPNDAPIARPGQERQ
jgi:Caspase domain